MVDSWCLLALVNLVLLMQFSNAMLAHSAEYLFDIKRIGCYRRKYLKIFVCGQYYVKGANIT